MDILQNDKSQTINQKYNIDYLKNSVHNISPDNEQYS